MAARVTGSSDPARIGLPAVRRGWLTWPVTEVRRALEGPIVRNAASLYGATIITSLLGFIYWFVAARLVPAEAVGIASALQSAAQFLAYFCVIGLNTLVISELSADKQRARSLILTAVATVGVVSLVLSALVAVGLRDVSSAIREGVHGPVGLLVFALLSCLTTVLLVLDDACIGLLRGDLQLKRNAVFAVSKLALLPLLIWAWSSRSGIELVVAWLAGLAISISDARTPVGQVDARAIRHDSSSVGCTKSGASWLGITGSTSRFRLHACSFRSSLSSYSVPGQMLPSPLRFSS